VTHGRRLVATADDLGLHPAIDAGVFRACDLGIVTAVSLVAAGRSFPAAVAGLRARPAIDAGAHLVLVGERPLSPPGEIPSLLGRDGALLPGWPAFLRRWALGRIRLDDVERELRRQLARLGETGLPIVHANSHQHLHVLPGVFPLVAGLAGEHGIPFVRLPVPAGSIGAPLHRRAQVAALSRLARRAARRAPPTAGVRFLPQTLGIAEAGHLTPAALHRLVATVAADAELVCHPGTDEPQLAAAYRWGYRWGRETAALTDPAARRALAAAGVELTTFRRLAAPSGLGVHDR
jgi:predicted glycoside hydrolase/deacetylase ChbG (UPF0249 family)